MSNSKIGKTFESVNNTNGTKPEEKKLSFVEKHPVLVKRAKRIAKILAVAGGGVGVVVCGNALSDRNRNYIYLDQPTKISITASSEDAKTTNGYSDND